MDEPSPASPANPVLRYLAILSAARDFGLSRADLELAVERFDPLTVEPEVLADALADALLVQDREWA